MDPAHHTEHNNGDHLLLPIEDEDQRNNGYHQSVPIEDEDHQLVPREDEDQHNIEDHELVSTEGEDKKLADSIEARLPTGSPLSPRCCIFRVPEGLRRNNDPNAFEPGFVAIGPFHRKKERLQFMEEVKKWYLKSLLSRTKVSMLSLIEGIKASEKQARESYQGPIDVDDKRNEFLEMMLIDGCFLIEFFRRREDPKLRSRDDPISNMSSMNFHHDLLLLENQLPWFILEKLYDLTKPNDQTNPPPPFIQLVLQFFSPYSSMTHSAIFDKFRCLHLVHLLREVLVSSFCDTGRVYKPEHIPCVTRLLEAGVKFKKALSRSMMNITFEKGTLEIPPFLFNDSTEPMFRNLIAFEQCYPIPHLITSYAILMDSLINTSEDVEYLTNVGIIQNWLSAEDASKFFNGLYINTGIDCFYYDKLYKKVNEYYRRTWPKWRANLLRDYFRTPWTIISLVAAFILLVLTFLQTFYTIKQS